MRPHRAPIIYEINSNAPGSDYDATLSNRRAAWLKLSICNKNAVVITLNFQVEHRQPDSDLTQICLRLGRTLLGEFSEQANYLSPFLF